MRELAEHPAETAALLAMAVAMWRLAPRRPVEQKKWGNRSLSRARLLPLGVMAALCIVGLSACISDEDRPVAVAPKLEEFGRNYPEDFAAAGRKIAVEQCASCHAIDQDTRSPNPKAPPMKTLISKYDANRLTDDLIAGIRVGHEKMPLFDFNVIAADSLIAYLETLDTKRDER